MIEVGSNLGIVSPDFTAKGGDSGLVARGNDRGRVSATGSAFPLSTAFGVDSNAVVARFRL
jgi:hypothetical protein